MARAHAHMTAPPAPSSPIHVVVDLNRCQASAQRCFFAPSAFKLHGEEALWYDPAPAEAQREHVLRGSGVSCSGHRRRMARRQSNADQQRSPMRDTGTWTAFKDSGRIVIIGASLAGFSAARALQDL